MSEAELPLQGFLVVDCSRMLPGNVLARTLLDLGARLVKVEDPGLGDAMRITPPLVEGTGAGFAELLRGAESVCLDLSSPKGARALVALARRADVLVESFRPGTMDRWGLGAERLRAENPKLVVLSMSGFGSTGPWARRIAHDMNVTAASGLMELVMPAEGIPRAQLADVTTALLASSALLAALLRRARTGEGARLEQPLATGALPHLGWLWADQAAGGGGIVRTVLGGRCPAYRTYECEGGELLALGTLEPKFWLAFVQAIGRPHLAGAGLDLGEDGAAAARELEALFRTAPRAHWLALCEGAGLPASPVRSLEQAIESGFFAETGLEAARGGGPAMPGPYLPSLGRRPARPAPRHGEHTEAVLAELGLSGEDE